MSEERAERAERAARSFELGARRPGVRALAVSLHLSTLLCSAVACTTGAPSEREVASDPEVAAPAISELAWVAVKSEHFQLLGNADPETLREVAIDLERFRAYLVQIGVALESSYALHPRIFLLTDAWPEWGRLSPSAGPGAALFSTRQGPYAVLAVSAGSSPGDRPAVSLGPIHHAYVHVAVSDNRPFRYPTWYEEGLAEYLTSFDVDPSGAVEVGLPVAARVEQMRVGDWLSLNELMATTRLHGVPTGQAWITTHYLSSTPHRHAQLTRYLRLYASGQSSDAAYRASFELAYPELMAEVGAYGAQGEYPYARLDASEFPPPPVLETHHLTRSEAQILTADLFLRGLGKIAAPADADEVAETLLDRALTESPDSAWAHAGLAALRMQQDRRQDARGLLEKAVTLDPGDPQVHSLWGDWLLEEAFAYAEGSEERLRLIDEARVEYRFAIRRSPTEADAFVGLGESYLRTDEKDPEALDALEAASLLLPLDLDVLRMLAEMQIRYGNLPAARANLERVASRAESSELRAQATGRLASLAHGSATEP